MTGLVEPGTWTNAGAPSRPHRLEVADELDGIFDDNLDDDQGGRAAVKAAGQPCEGADQGHEQAVRPLVSNTDSPGVDVFGDPTLSPGDGDCPPESIRTVRLVVHARRSVRQGQGLTHAAPSALVTQGVQSPEKSPLADLSSNSEVAG
ncbi:MAG: hypothetical protein ACYDGR_02455 [Candidatus Dormibacteria bacterium]